MVLVSSVGQDIIATIRDSVKQKTKTEFFVGVVGVSNAVGLQTSLPGMGFKC